jgi:hypothetical protein
MKTQLTFLFCLFISFIMSAQDIRQLSWLSGDWHSDDGVTEIWMSPEGGTMPGISRTIINGRTVNYEFMIIRSQGDSLFFTAIPSGQKETTFRLTSLTSNEAVFENPEHDFPKKISYSLKDNILTARVEGGEMSFIIKMKKQ